MNTPMIRLTLAAAFGIAIASPAFAQSTLGGAKTQQNKIGGLAKTAPVIGGAATPPPSPAKPGAVVNTVSPTSPAATPSGRTSNAALAQRPNPPVTAPKPTSAV